ncbi:Inner membrane metabolite transport protein yhjE [Delftia tsuruhatensis]|uniref:MFS transporter n=1 Tax=Delftia tsuruhatensis TaxID=180282 RepID=UPI001E71DB81|nr:MFS transporter [Delftia tsuruhatensis]CAB5691311.1 Inner membrane metabolite transport protein yhjE [Delftia tsuruhatensis]CAC9676904.1 Inner membrane metabolite transport protein yhjE [Delftia tsuruhatensis]
MPTTASLPLPQQTARSREDRKVLTATLVGTTIEWYDYFIYAQAAGLVLGPLFFTPFAQDNPGLSLLLAFATVGVAFLFRPLGAIVCGHLGDRFGRKAVLSGTLILMGAATTLIGLLPGYAQIGLWAPVLLILLRVLQGFSAGGEWGGAALMAVEHAPAGRRSFFGAFPQIGVPLGMIAATGVLWVVTAILGKERFVEWGWRLPFLFSVALVVVGGLIRRSVQESPVFLRMHQRRRESAAPLGHLWRHHRRQVLLTALIFVGNNAAGYLLVAYFLSYGQRVLQLPPQQLLAACTAAAFGWLLSTLAGGLLGDRIGRVRTFQIGYVVLAVWAIPLWLLVDTGQIGWFLLALLVLSVPLGLTYGPQAALYAEMFPARVRYSGVSVGYALGSILGGAFAATIAQSIIATWGRSWLVGAYIVAMAAISFIAVSCVQDRPGASLDDAG